MAVVLDQFEIEPRTTYESGSYDQVVMGRMLDSQKLGNIRRYSIPPLTGSRGVVFGLVNADQATPPGTTFIDYNTSISYRSQPYREKAGNVRAAKHLCYEERIYDTLTPDPVQCFEKNGAYIFNIPPGPSSPGFTEGFSNVINSCAFMIFDFYMPSTLPQRAGVDLHWTKSFPFEPRYSSVERKKYQSFDVTAKYSGDLLNNTFTKRESGKKMSGLIVGTIGPGDVTSSNIRNPTYLNNSYGNWFHLWATDITVISTVGSSYFKTGSMNNDDMMKVLFGYGDSTTAFFSSSYVDSYGKEVLMGTSNWPMFRANRNTKYVLSPPVPRYYDKVTGSYWTVSPVIRGWKYGLYSALPSYTHTYFRQGKFGQNRDMLEQRQYTKLMLNQIDTTVSSVTRASFSYEKDDIGESVITVKFLDEDGNLTPPENTQSQNLSFEATSSLPYFDLVTRNREQAAAQNLRLVDIKVDAFGKVRV